MGKLSVLMSLCGLLVLASHSYGAATENGGTVKVYPAPAGETLSNAFAVNVEGRDCPVYLAKVAPRDLQRRWKAMDDKKNSADYFELASFAIFDMQGTVQVTITCPEPIRTARVLPTSAGIVPAIHGKRLTLTLREPRPLTIEINDDWCSSLHLFANPFETHVPKPGDPNVIYFGPGIHEVSHLVVGDNQTVYVAGGAVVRCIIKPDEPSRVGGEGLRNYAPSFELRGKNITFRGRGIIDAGACTTHARNMIFVRGSDITLEGVILRDSSVWTIPIRQSDRVTVKNVKLLGHRANSDGIDICNSRDVTVEGCFIRTLDDLIVIKSDRGQGEVRRIVARDCTLWNEVAHALSVGAELRENVDDVLFTNCDVIHDKGREWTLRVYHCDSAKISNIRFESIRIEETRRLISLWIGKAIWTLDAERGHIQGVLFKDIQASGEKPRVELKGFDADHQVEDVKFENVLVNGKALGATGVETNGFVRGMEIRP
ncbi:MAG: glycosyl hydrolase family 28 protein [Bacillota bacterium]